MGLAILVLEVGGGGQAGQRADDAAIDGGQSLGELPKVPGASAGHLLEQLRDDACEAAGVKDGDGLGERTQGGAGAAELPLDLLQGAGLLQGAQGAEGGVEEGQQEQQAVVVVMQGAVAGGIARATDLV